MSNFSLRHLIRCCPHALNPMVEMSTCGQMCRLARFTDLLTDGMVDFYEMSTFGQTCRLVDRWSGRFLFVDRVIDLLTDGMVDFA